MAEPVPYSPAILATADDDGKIIGRRRNRREADRDPTAHAEIIAL